MDNKSTDGLLQTIRDRFRQAADAEAEIRSEARADLRFVAGEQWDAQVLSDRKAAGRPALVHNRVESFIHQISNEARQQKPQIRFSPVENADDDTAEVHEGLARHIQYDSNASLAYETAVDYQTSCSFGFYRLITDYAGPDSFDQELMIQPVTDPFGVYGVLIPAIRRQKCRFAFVVETIPRAEYKAQYGESGAFQSFAEGDSEGWITEDEVRIAEYWELETRQKKLAQLADGSVLDADKVPAGVPILRLREVDEDVVRFSKVNGAEVIPGSETEWVGSSIPILAVLGKSLIVDGKPRLFSKTRFLRDPQQLINYTKSRIAEALATSPISPYIAVEGQFKGHEQQWAQANTQLRPYLEYRNIGLNGEVLGPPQRQVYEPPIQALSQFLMQEIDELKAISGIFDASLGSESNETSGVAIARRQQQSNIANLHFLDNLTRAHEQAGRIIAECIPKLYDTARMVRILGEDEAQKIVKVNQLYRDEQGNFKQHNLSAGKYDVTVTSGRAFSTKKLETFDALSQLVQGNPQLMPIIGDIVFRNSDMAGANEISERFKKMLPPNLQGDDEKGAAQVPPQVQAQMQGLSQQNEQLTQAVNVLTEELKAKKYELDSRERIAAMQEETKRSIAFASLDQRDGITLLAQEIATLKGKYDQQHEAMLQQTQQQHEAMLQQAQQQHQAGLQQGQQDHQAGLQESQQQAAQLQQQQQQPEAA